MTSKKTVTRELLQIINKERDYVSLFGSLFRLLVYFLFSLMFYFNYSAQRKYLESKQIFIKNPGHRCEYETASVPTISENSIKNCKNSGGSINASLKIYTEPLSGDKYIITESGGLYYRSLCNGFCVLKDDGTCQDQPVSHQRCLQLLDPGENCTNNSKPIGAYENKKWYALSVRQIPGCSNFNSS